MKNENGITLITIAVTIVIMGILAGLLVRASVGGSLLKKANDVQENYYDMIDDTDEKMENLKQKWDGVI